MAMCYHSLMTGWLMRAKVNSSHKSLVPFSSACLTIIAPSCQCRVQLHLTADRSDCEWSQDTGLLTSLCTLK